MTISVPFFTNKTMIDQLMMLADHLCHRTIVRGEPIR